MGLTVPDTRFPCPASRPGTGIAALRASATAPQATPSAEFEEARRIAWHPSEVGRRQPGHLWRWELAPAGDSRTLVTHTYDWTLLTDRNRLPRARSTTPDKLMASLDRLAAIAESAG